MTTGPRKSRTPRNKKRHWRKGTNLEDVEEFMQVERIEQSEGGPLRERDDSQIFAIDRLPEEVSEKLTRKQTAVVNKLKLLQEVEAGSDTEDVKPSKESLKRNFPKKKSKIAPIIKKSKIKSESETAKAYDLWAEEEKKPVSAEISLAEDHFMRTTKRRKPNEPKTVKHVTSLLPSVEVAEAGASYNPSLSHYQKYVENIAKDEVGVVRSEERIEKAVKLAVGQTYITEEEKMVEESAGLFDEKEEEEHETEQQSNKEGETKKPKAANRKTKKKRRAEEMNRKKKIAQQSEKGTKNVEQHIYKVKKLNKEVSEELSNVAKKANLRRKKKSLKRLLGTQQLGGGKFKPEEQPFLLTEELSGSLRTLKPQGDVLGDRLKSLQKRNMMPVPGEEKVRSKLKQRLRVKLTERRSHKDVKLGSRVI